MNRCHCEYPMPPRGMCKHRNCDCHCEEAAAAADEAISTSDIGDCFAAARNDKQVSQQCSAAIPNARCEGEGRR